MQWEENGETRAKDRSWRLLVENAVEEKGGKKQSKKTVTMANLTLDTTVMPRGEQHRPFLVNSLPFLFCFHRLYLFIS